MATKKTNKSITKKKKSVNSLIKNRKFFIQLFVVVVLGVGVFLVAKKYRGLFLAGTVNTTPITRWQLNQKMAEQYGKQVFDEIVNQTLLSSIAKKEQIVVSAEDIDKEIEKIKEQLGGEDALNKTLVQYGMTMDNLKDRLKTTLIQQKIAQKMFAEEVKVTDEEVNKAYAESKSPFADKNDKTDKTPEEAKKDISKQLKDQKLQQKFFTWFEEQKNQAQISSYL